MRAPTALLVVIFGVRIEIQFDDASIVDRISSCLPSGWSLCGPTSIDRIYRFSRTETHRVEASPSIDPVAVASGWRVFADGALVARSNDFDELCERFQSDLELFVAIHARTRVIVHAGVVGWQGRAIVIPGRSFSGKTTLVAALIRLGAEYYSDEYAVFDPRGLVWPFPKPLSIRKASGAREARPAEAAGGIVGRKPIPVGWILVTQYRPAEMWEPRDLTHGQAILALLANAAAARYQPGFLFATFRAAVRGSVALQGVRGDATAFAHHLLTHSFTTESRTADLLV
jgi:hypothetical protein